MPVFVVRGETPRDGSLPRRHLSSDCPALLAVEEELIERVRNTRRLRERTQRCRDGCWAEYEVEHEGAQLEGELAPEKPALPAWPIKTIVTLLDDDVNGPEEHPFAEVEVQWVDPSRVRVTFLGGAPAQIRQAHLTGKPGQDNVVIELESPMASPAPDERVTKEPSSSFIPLGTTVSSKIELTALLRRWYTECVEEHIGDVGQHQGNTAWIKINIADHRFRMHADTTRPAIARYLELAAEHGPSFVWHIRPTSRSEAVRKVCLEPDASPTPGFFVYSNTEYVEPLTL